MLALLLIVVGVLISFGVANFIVDMFEVFSGEWLYFEQKYARNWKGNVVAFLIICLGTLFTFWLVAVNFESGTEFGSKTVLYSVADSTGQYGKFSLGYGTVDTEMYYFGYTQNSNGGFISVKYRADDCVIYYDKKQPRVEIYNTWIKTFGIKETTSDECKIFVPEGSVIQNYRFDAE